MLSDRARHDDAVRIAPRLNALWERKGTVFADHYHRVDLTSSSEVRRAIR